MRLSSAKILAVLCLVACNAAEASGPQPPQQQQAETGTAAQRTITLEVDPGDTLFVDPLWAGGGQGTCRYVTNPSANQWVIQIGSRPEWQSFETDTDTQYSENYASQQVCCRPSPANVTLCSGASGGTQQAQIVGGGSNGYAVLGASGAATATCINPPYGDYVETATFTCGRTGAGTAADGQWSGEVSDTPTCQPNSYQTFGACNVSCGGGNQLHTVYNSCGQITSQAYDGPSCNTQACCTTNWVKSCGGSTATYTDEGTCHSGSYTVANGCTFETYACGASCSPSYGDILGPEADGCTYNYDDCWADGNWAPPPNAISCTPSVVWCEPVQVSGCQNPANNGSTKSCGAVTAVSCTCGDWQ